MCVCDRPNNNTSNYVLVAICLILLSDKLFIYIGLQDRISLYIPGSPRICLETSWHQIQRTESEVSL